MHYVHCFLPFPDAATKGRDSKATRAGEPETQGESCEPGLMQPDVPLLRAQVRGSRLLDTLRIHRQGGPALASRWGLGSCHYGCDGFP